MYNGHKDKTKAGRIKGERWGLLGQGGVVGEKGIQLYLNNNKKKKSGQSVKKKVKYKNEFLDGENYEKQYGLSRGITTLWGF